MRQPAVKCEKCGWKSRSPARKRDARRRNKILRHHFVKRHPELLK